MKIIRNRDAETPLSIEGEIVRADWYRAGEGYNGDYNPNDPEDDELLRFDIYINVNGEWEPVDDASYCTSVTVDTPEEELERKLKVIYERFADVLESDPEQSVKKLGEELSWIS